VTQEIEVELVTTVLEQVVPPMLTMAPVRKPVPVIVNGVDPAVVPNTGETLVIVGAG
jgi:hypothetical protein